MQECTHCGIRLIIGLTGDLIENGTDSPDIACSNCGQVNEVTQSVREADHLMTTWEMVFTPMCVMCGKEYGTRIREDGRYYHSACWQVWQS